MNEEYRKRDAINQSLLVALSKGIGSYNKVKDLYYEETPHFDIGDAVDILLTSPCSFNDVFFVSDELAKKPGKGSISVVKEVYDIALKDYGEDIPLSLEDDRLVRIIDNACRNQEYGGGWSEERKYEDVLKKGTIYYSALIESEGRIVLSTKQKELAQGLADKLKEHEFTAWIFDQKPPGVEIVFQEPLYGEYRTHQVKGLLDIMIINHNDYYVNLDDVSIAPTTVLPIDIKTIGDSVKAFPRSSRTRRYDVQGAWYSLLCGLNYPGYRIDNFMFVVVSTSTNEFPLIYQMTEIDLRIARYGGYYNYGENSKQVVSVPSLEIPTLADLDILGFEQMLDLYEWHLLEHQWEYDKHIVENNGILNLDSWS